MAALNIDMIRGKIKAIVGEILGYYSGKEEVIRKILAAALAGGHVLLEDKPGVGKTFLAKLMQRSWGGFNSQGYNSLQTYCPVT